MHLVSKMEFPDLEFIISNPVSDLPFFNQDLDSEENVPDSVRVWRKRIEVSGGIIFFTPEYAHSIPGSLKNAIEWLVSSFEIIEKPCMVISSAPNHLGAERANSMLQNLLVVISAKIYKNLSVCIGSINKKITEDGFLQNSETEDIIKQSLLSFIKELNKIKQ